MIEWLEEWFRSMCDRDWEQENQVVVKFVIQSTGNPGWLIEVDLSETLLEGATFEMDTIDNSGEWGSGNDDWWFVKVKDNKFKAAGDPGKLAMLLAKLRKSLENGDINSIRFS